MLGLNEIDDGATTFCFLHRHSKTIHALAVFAHPCASRHRDFHAKWARLLKRVFGYAIAFNGVAYLLGLSK